MTDSIGVVDNGTGSVLANETAAGAIADST